MSATIEAKERLATIETLFGLQSVVADLGKSFGVNLKQTSPEIFNHLLTLPIAQLKFAESNFISLREDFQLCGELGVNPWDDKEFFRLSMRKVGVSYPGDLMDRIQDEDIVECYDMDRRQVFRNLRFMEATSYSLLEVLTHDWPSLYERPQQITNMIIKWGEVDIFTENRVIDLDIPAHFIRELRSSTPQICRIHHKFFAPLYSGPNRPYGCVSVCSGQALEGAANPVADNVRFI